MTTFRAELPAVSGVRLLLFRRVAKRRIPLKDQLSLERRIKSWLRKRLLEEPEELVGQAGLAEQADNGRWRCASPNSKIESLK
jgi:hypothetical protein